MDLTSNFEPTTAAATVVASKTTARTSNFGKLQNTGVLTRDDFSGGPISLDEIEPGLYLGNLSAATHMKTLKAFKITHILTLDSVPLPQHITEATFLKTKYVHIADMAKEDILHHLDACVEFISDAIKSGGNILVHCYFGVSRSSSVVIAYVMKQHNMDYQTAFELVKSKRRFVQPNLGFVAQLKLYERMGCKIDAQYQKYKLFRLRLAGEQVRKAKILPQSFHNLIKADPAITQENPEPIVYRCRKCRRIVAAKSHVLLHYHKTQANVAASNVTAESAPTTTRLLDQISAQIRKVSIDSVTDAAAAGAVADNAAASNNSICNSILFVEPIAWMQNITNNTQGRLNCPKCEQKLGNFSWINGCQCPCGAEVSPAFYLIPSKVELQKFIQNVQTTL